MTNKIELKNIEETKKFIQQDISNGLTSLNAHLDWVDGTHNKVTINEFAPLEIDEPIEFGGKNFAPNPVEYILTGAVGCFAISFEIFASEQGIILEKVSIDIDANVNLAVFLGLTEGEKGILNPVIKMKVSSSESLEEIQKIANKALLSSIVLNSLKASVELVVEK